MAIRKTRKRVYAALVTKQRVGATRSVPVSASPVKKPRLSEEPSTPEQPIRRRFFWSLSPLADDSAPQVKSSEQPTAEQPACQQQSQDLKLDELRNLMKLESPETYIDNSRVADRQGLLKNIEAIATDLRLSARTVHLAVRYLDKCLASSELDDCDGETMSQCCLLMALKFEEPRAASRQMGRCFNTKLLSTMEMRVLRVLNYQLAIPTAKTFQDLILELLSVEADERAILETWIPLFLNLPLVHQDMAANYRPSLLAAAVVCLAAAGESVSSSVTQQVMSLTKYSTHELDGCKEHLLTVGRADRKAESRCQ